MYGVVNVRKHKMYNLQFLYFLADILCRSTNYNPSPWNSSCLSALITAGMESTIWNFVTLGVEDAKVIWHTHNTHTHDQSLQIYSCATHTQQCYRRNVDVALGSVSLTIFSLAIPWQIRWKFRLAVIPLLAVKPQQIFAHATRQSCRTMDKIL